MIEYEHGGVRGPNVLDETGTLSSQTNLVGYVSWTVWQTSSTYRMTRLIVVGGPSWVRE